MTPYITPRLTGASAPHDKKSSNRKTSSGHRVHPYMKNNWKGTLEIQQTREMLYNKAPLVTGVDFRIVDTATKPICPPVW